MAVKARDESCRATGSFCYSSSSLSSYSSLLPRHLSSAPEKQSLDSSDSALSDFKRDHSDKGEGGGIVEDEGVIKKDNKGGHKMG